MLDTRYFTGDGLERSLFSLSISLYVGDDHFSRHVCFVPRNAIFTRKIKFLPFVGKLFSSFRVIKFSLLSKIILHPYGEVYV